MTFKFSELVCKRQGSSAAIHADIYHEDHAFVSSGLIYIVTVVRNKIQNKNALCAEYEGVSQSECSRW